MRNSALQRQAAAALEVLARVREAVGRDQAADQALATLLRAHREYGSRDRRLFGQLVFSHFRWQGWLADLPTDEARAAAAFHLDATERHPAVDQWAVPNLAPVGRLDLAGKADALAAWFQRPHPPDWRDLVPPWTGSELLDDGTPEPLHRFVSAVQLRPPLWLRCRRGQAPAVTEALHRLGIDARAHPHLPEALAIDGTVPLAELQKQVPGAFEVQDLASQIVGLCCEPQAGQQWWDVCAGSGGKALHLSDLMNGRGKVIATDTRPGALSALAQRARASRTPNLAIAGPDRSGEIPLPPVQSQDGLLVDAPCSGLGTWSRNPDARWRTRAEQLPERGATQLAILRRAAPAVRPGGTLVYAVCSLARTETTRVADEFLAAEPRFAPAPLPNPLHPGQPPSSHLAIHPDAGPGIGMFIARFKMQQ
jgi:16S rRNA (cytosine967-C5)-methyltransferase